ncbi:hypothetical protein J2T60_000003 [Natronospira proteinivora]|uniref:Yip1-like protein n=1 Tax=Natronospira proteinivora TaxID=1807133 RepID=A0ABT1G6U8_9GAMM|nr:hypothetical protein [Natronospira proteinivora]MCP1726038.1 hypothetical protein [Natronospira proteinivora]
MRDWFQTGWHILVFRQGPQDLPPGHGWMLIALLAYLLSGAVLSLLRDVSHPIAGLLLLDIAITTGFFILVLYGLGRSARLPQSLQAVWLCGTGLNLVGMIFAPALAEPPADGSLWLDIAVVVSLSLVFWSIALLAHILRHSLEWPFHRALALAVLYSVFNIMSTFYVFPPNG